MTTKQRNLRTRIDARIDPNNSSEVKTWCSRFDCTEDELRLAFVNVGTVAVDAGNWLITHRNKSKSIRQN
ncbi:MAG TPA: DUF3606 domain-containing protein [Chryseolinea sp.]|jgi:hypothetical protein|nr:DUF3606 domain-containing protein [Chryseolinea sp.]